MHTKETKWQDAPLELVKTLEICLCTGKAPSVNETRQASATIRALVQALEQKIHELDSLEPSE